MVSLVEIKDLRVGQVYLDDKNGFIRVIIPFDDEPKTIAGNSLFYKHNREIKLADSFEDIEHEDIPKTHKLIGKLGITHKIENYKLIEVLRDGFQVDDIVVETDKVIEKVITYKTIVPHSNHKYFMFFDGVSCESNTFYDEIETLKKIGIYGVTHEFVNNCEVQDE